MNYDDLKWIEVDNVVKTFRLGNEPELIHVIKTGFDDKYMIVFEDAYELNLGEVIFLNKKETEDRFRIKLD